MKRITIIAAALVATAGVQAQGFSDTARVRSVQPRYETVSVPRQQCTTEWVTENRSAMDPRNYGGVVLGGVIGGLAGNQIGKGNGRTAATAVGAVVGAMAGDHVASQNGWGRQQTEQRQVQRCQTVNDVERRHAGYHVTYEYRGQVHSTVMDEHPGRTVPVQVAVSAPQRSQYRQASYR